MYYDGDDLVTKALSSSEYPFASHYFKIAGLNYHYLDEGQGPPVLMVHGNPSWSFYYRNVVKALKGQYRCLVPDHIGCGFSDKPSDEQYHYTLESRIRNLTDFVNSLNISEPLRIIAHDWGGVIAMGFATRFPEKVHSLVMLNTAAFHLPKTKKLPLALKFVRNWQIGAFLVRSFNLFSVGASTVGCLENPMPMNIQKLYQLPYNNWHNRIATLRFVQDIPLTAEHSSFAVVSEIEENLSKLSHKPIFLGWGLKDFVFDQHFLNKWISLFPKAQVVTYPKSGHYILEDQKNDLIPKIQHFLQEN